MTVVYVLSQVVGRPSVSSLSLVLIRFVWFGSLQRRRAKLKMRPSRRSFEYQAAGLVSLMNSRVEFMLLMAAVSLRLMMFKVVKFSACGMRGPRGGFRL